MTDPFDLYPVVAQVAATFAGFGSLASGLGQRRAGDDARMDAYRLRSMLLVSLSATLLGLLPATFAGLKGDETWGVHVAAWIAAGSILIHTPASMWKARKLRSVAGFSKTATMTNLICVWGAFIAFILCARNGPGNDDSSLYLLGLMGMLGSSLMLFSRVIVSMLAPFHRAGEEPQAEVRASDA